MSNKIQNDIDDALNGTSSNDEESTNNQSTIIDKGINKISNKAGRTLQEKLSNPKEDSPVNGADKNTSENLAKSNNKKDMQRNINNAKNEIKQLAKRMAKQAKTEIKRKIQQRAILKIILSIISALLNPFVIIAIVAIIIFVTICGWFQFNNDNINGAFYDSYHTEIVEYNPKTNEIESSKLGTDNVLAGVFFQYFAENAYYYTVSPYIDENGNLKTNLKDAYNTDLRQHKLEDTKENATDSNVKNNNFKVKDKFGTEQKFTLNAIMLMNLNKAINENTGKNLYYPQNFIRPIFNTCSIADNQGLYNAYLSEHENTDDSNIASDILKIETRKSFTEKSDSELKEIYSKTKDERIEDGDITDCQRLNLFSDKDVVSLSAKYKVSYLNANYEEISESEYKQLLKEGKKPHLIYKPVDNEYQKGTWSWGLAPIFNYQEYQERDEVRNIKVYTVPKWDRNEQKFNSVSYNSLSDEEKEIYKGKIKTNWNDITQNIQYAYLIDSVQTYMGTAENGTELREEFAMDNYTNFNGSTDTIELEVEKLAKSTDDLSKLDITEVITKNKSYTNIKDIYYGYSEDDIDYCKAEIDACYYEHFYSVPLGSKWNSDKYGDIKKCKSYSFQNISQKPDNYTPNTEYTIGNMQKCHQSNNHEYALYIEDKDGKTIKIADSLDSLDNGDVKVYYKSKAKSTVIYAGQLFEFRANYTDDFAKVEDVNFNYITQYLENYTMFIPFEKKEVVSSPSVVKNVTVSIEDYAKFYAMDENGQPQFISTKNTYEENQKNINDYVESEKEKGVKEKTIQMFDFTFSGTNCQKHPEKCILYSEKDSIEWLNGATVHSETCNGQSNCTSWKSILPNDAIPTADTINNTNLDATSRATSIYLRIADLIGIKVGSDMDAANSTFGSDSFSGTFIQGDLCVYEGNKGKTKSYMDYRKITSKTSAQYKYIHGHFADGTLKVMDNGLLMTNDGFIGVALGSHYGKIGDKFIFTLSTGKQLKVVKLDEKADKDTDPNGCYHLSDKSTIEFVIQADLAKEAFGTRGGNYVAGGNFNNIEEFSGEITGVQVAEGSISDSTDNNFDSNANATNTINSSTGIAIGGKAQDSRVAKIKNDASYDLMVKYGNQFGVDTDLIVAIAANISNGKHDISNCKKNGGPCGIMGLSFKDTSKLTFNSVFDTTDMKEHNYTLTIEDAKDLETNIKYGVIKLAVLLKMYEYNPLMTIYAYNQGADKMEDALNDYIEKSGNPDRKKVCEEYSDIAWTGYAKTSKSAISVLSDVLQYYAGSSMHFKKISGSELIDVSVSLNSLNQETISVASTSSTGNSLSAKLQSKIDTLMSGDIVENNWDLLFPYVDKETANIDYDTIKASTFDGIDEYTKVQTSQFNQTDVENIIKNSYLVGSENADITSLDNLTELDWEQKFMESFGSRSGNITTDTSKYYPGVFVGIANSNLTIYQPYGSVRDTDSGKYFYHNYVGVKASDGTKLQTPADGVVYKFGENNEDGKFVIINHGDLSQSKFSHLKNLSSDLSENMQLTAGQIIGTSSEENFHYQLQVNGKVVNPEWVIRKNQENNSTYTNSDIVVTGNSEIGNKIATIALTKVGSKYVYGAAHSMSAIKNPNQSVFDCSSFTSWAYYQAGVNVGNNTTATFKYMGQLINRNAMQAGDIILFSDNGALSGVHHVGIYIGGGKMVHAANSRTGVIVSDITSGYYDREFLMARRLY